MFLLEFCTFLCNFAANYSWILLLLLCICFFDNAALFPWQIREGDADANNVGAVEEDDEEEDDEQAAKDKESGGGGSKGEKGEEEEDGK